MRQTVEERFEAMTQAERQAVMDKMRTVQSHEDVMRIMGYEPVGFWVKEKTAPKEHGLLWPGDLIDAGWDPAQRELVLGYVKRPHTDAHVAYGGCSWCRLCAEVLPSYKERGTNTLEPWEMLGSAEFTDGVFIWPEGYAHYVEVHRLKPPQDFIDHIVANDGKFPVKKPERKRKK